MVANNEIKASAVDNFIIVQITQITEDRRHNFGILENNSTTAFNKDYFLKIIARTKGGSSEIYFQTVTASYSYNSDIKKFSVNFTFTGKFECQQISCKHEARAFSQAQYLILDKLLRF